MSTIKVPRSLQPHVRLVAWLVRLLARTLFFRTQLVRLAVRGKEHIPRQGGAILVGNHPSPIDWAFLYPVLPRQATFFAMTRVMERGLLGKYLTWSGHLPVEIDKSPTSLEERQRIHALCVDSIRKAVRLLQAGGLLTFYPEGYCEDDPDLLEPFQSTILATLTRLCPVPIIPIGITDTDVYSSFQSGWWQLWRYPFQRVTLSIGVPIDARVIDREYLNRHVAEQISALSNQTLHPGWSDCVRIKKRK